jgi:hypothetical protein
MGSIIGLVDGNGNEIADFRYDSFGNLQTPEALPSELGEDFRPILIQIFYLKKEPQTQQMANPKPGWLEI